MSQTVLREDKPACFGRVDDPVKQEEGWNPQVSACAGGPDPAYTNEKTGSHVRDRCMFFQQCGAVANAKKFEGMRQTLISPTSLVKQPPVVGQTIQVQQAAPNKLAESLQQQQAIQQQQQYNAMMAQMQQMQRMGIQPQQMMVPGYQQMMPVNYQMPGYLTSPEVIEPGGFWKAVARTVFRSVGKSVGHSVAHMFDSVPFSALKPPEK